MDMASASSAKGCTVITGPKIWTDAASHGRVNVNVELYACEGVYYYCTYKVCANGAII